MPQTVKILTKLWFCYFMVSIAVVGLLASALIHIPHKGLSYVIPRWRRVHEYLICRGIDFLMKIQPWLSARVDIDVPNGRVLLVSNHRSHLDVFILLSRIPGIRVLAKSSLFRIPGLAVMMRATGQIRVTRGNLDAWVNAMDEVGARLRRGETVHVFPEMTRCPRGFQGIQKFTAGPFLAAMKEDALILPLVFKNTDAVWAKGEAALNFRRPVEVRSLAPLRARDFATADLLKREVALRIEQALL